MGFGNPPDSAPIAHRWEDAGHPLMPCATCGQPKSHLAHAWHESDDAGSDTIQLHPWRGICPWCGFARAPSGEMCCCEHAHMDMRSRNIALEAESAAKDARIAELETALRGIADCRCQSDHHTVEVDTTGSLPAYYRGRWVNCVEARKLIVAGEHIRTADRHDRVLEIERMCFVCEARAALGAGAAQEREGEA